MTPKQFAKKYNRLGSIRAVCGETGKTYHAMSKLYKKAMAEGFIEVRGSGPVSIEERKKPTPEGRVKALKTHVTELPKKGEVKRYIFTCAQNNTRIHTGLWDNLRALSKHYDAELHVARFIYHKNGLGARGDKAEIVKKPNLYESYMEWQKELLPFLSDERMEIAPGLVWCGEMNILPTATRPLSGMEPYTGRKSGVFPHAKVSMQSVPSSKFEATKFNYTTGTVTMRNYIQRKAGLKAEFHHCYGGLLVEVNSDGDWFVRQLNADSAGTIYDLDVKAKKGKVTEDHRVEAISWGDIHVQQIDPTVLGLSWGDGGMLDSLRPKQQFIHDVFDFNSRSRHERYDHHRMFNKHVQGGGNNSVEQELKNTAAFLRDEVKRDWCETVVVESNHDNMLERWLRDDPSWYAKDPQNAVLFLELQLEKYQAIAHSDDTFLLLERALQRYGYLGTGAARFLREDESFIICPDANGGIECGMHGHYGPNGSRGGANAFARMGRKANTGHTHSAGIHDGIYTAGTSSNLDLGYNKGPSSWSHSHIVTYPNGKRAIITMWNGKWRA